MSVVAPSNAINLDDETSVVTPSNIGISNVNVTAIPSMGSSQITRGFICGHAYGNAWNRADFNATANLNLKFYLDKDYHLYYRKSMKWIVLGTYDQAIEDNDDIRWEMSDRGDTHELHVLIVSL